MTQHRYDPLSDPDWAFKAANRAKGSDPDTEEAFARLMKEEPPSEPPEPPRRRVQLTAANTVTMRRVKWCWQGRWPMGALGLLAGMEGLGKSTVASDIAASLTRGVLPGEHYGTPKNVLICATEDSWAHTIVPRLVAARADLDRVYRIEAVEHDHGPDLGLSLPLDTVGLIDAVEQTNAAMLILDPLMSRLSERLDTHKDAEVRQGLEPVIAAAEATGLHICGLIHLNKATGAGDVLNRIMGSRAFTAVARSVSVVVNDADDETESTRLFGVPKNNLGRTDQPTLAFTVASAEVETIDGPTDVGHIRWGEERPISIRDAMGAAEEDNLARTAKREAVEWLNEYMEMYGPAVDSKEVKGAAKRAGHSESAIDRARSVVGLTSRAKPGVFPRETQWVEE